MARHGSRAELTSNVTESAMERHGSRADPGGFVAIHANYPCTGRDSRATLYSFGLAQSVLIATGISLLIIVFRKIIKVEYCS